MRTGLNAIACLALIGLPAAALEKDFVDQMLQAAKSIERDASAVSLALKNKRPDTDGVKRQIEAMGADVGKLHELVAKFESSNPSLSGRDRGDWQLIKEKVQLLEIFHDQKKKLAGEDLLKNRSLVRAHADGVAKRAQKLQESVARLERQPLS